MQVRWTGKKAYSFYGINVFVIAISLMNWVFFCLEAYACQGSSTPLLPLSPSPLCLYPTGNEQVTKNKRVKTISISFGGRDRGRLVLLQVNTDPVGRFSADCELRSRDMSPYYSNTHCDSLLLYTMSSKT